VEERVKRILVELDLPFPVIMDKNLDIFYEYGVVAVPSVAILDADKVIRAAPSGYSYTIRDRLTESVESVLGLISEEDVTVAVKPAYQPKLKASRYYNLAVQLTNQRLFEAALAKIDLATEADPRFSAPLNLRGQIRLQLGEPGPALDDLKRAVELDSSSVSARTGLGRALMETGDTTAALEQIEIALAMDPAYTLALQDKGICLAAMQKTDDAVAALKEAIELYPQDPQLFYSIGRIYRESGSTSNAVESYQKALQMLFPRP
jgi:tetratricopeptide (TPR) repeat protein